MGVAFSATAQHNGFSGNLTGNIIDTKERAIAGATVTLYKMGDSLTRFRAISNQLGEFRFSGISVTGYYSFTITFVGKSSYRLDSLKFRPDKFDFNIPDIILKDSSSIELAQVVIYAEKPLIESKEGNLTYNVTESATAAGSTASELLTQVPLIAKDADGKIIVRGKEPRILIDDKPVELNLQQLQDLLESMPGSSIEKN